MAGADDTSKTTKPPRVRLRFDGIHALGPDEPLVSRQWLARERARLRGTEPAPREPRIRPRPPDLSRVRPGDRLDQMAARLDLSMDELLAELVDLGEWCVTQIELDGVVTARPRSGAPPIVLELSERMRQRLRPRAGRGR